METKQTTQTGHALPVQVGLSIKYCRGWILMIICLQIILYDDASSSCPEWMRPMTFNVRLSPSIVPIICNRPLTSNGWSCHTKTRIPKHKCGVPGACIGNDGYAPTDTTKFVSAALRTKIEAKPYVPEVPICRTMRTRWARIESAVLQMDGRKAGVVDVV